MASPDRFDGLEVDRHQARFSGTVELDPVDADHMSVDTVFTAVIRCTVGGASVDANAKGDLIRTNKFKLDGFAVVRDGNLQDELFDKLPALFGADPEPPADPEFFAPAADINGEIITPDADPEVQVPSAFVEPEEEDDEEIFSPGAHVPRPRTAVPAGIPEPGGVPRRYNDPALEALMNERF